MAKDPAFLFYPGDYLRDTQTLSEKTQVAYDRIICEHMRNICISKSQLKFFTKRLSEDEKEELMFVLTKKNGGFQVEWVAESIEKRKAYSESRRKNRKRKNKQDMNNISSSYVPHMEDVNEEEDIDVVPIKKAYDFLKNKNPIEIEAFEMQQKKTFPDWNQFVTHFNYKVILDEIDWDITKLIARLHLMNNNWDKTPKANKNESVMDIIEQRE